MADRLDVRIAARSDAAARARHALDDLVHDAPRRTVDDARLMISELVTNALRHGSTDRGEIAVRMVVDRRRGRLRVEVQDEGPGFSLAPRTAESADDSGWGLYLVGELADRWGISSDGTTLVWFELDLDAGTSA